MAERTPSLPNNVEKCPCVALPQPHNEMEQFQPLQKDAGRDRPQQQQDCGRICLCSVGQKFMNLREMITFSKDAAQPGPALPQSIAPAPSLDLFGERIVSSPNQVPGFVRNMHQKLASEGPPDDRLFMDILRLTDAHPSDVAVTLLRCAPSCDRAAATMWKTIASSGTTMEKVLPTLLVVLEDWPVRKMFTSDGDSENVFSLAATRVLWEILRLPWCPEPFMEYSPHLLVALLYQVFISTEQTTEEVKNFWTKCQEEHNLPSINRFAVQTVRALFHHLQCVDILMAMERKNGWDTLLYADTHHYAVGLLAREMRRVSIPMCSCIALRLVRRLSREEPLWHLAAMAFLVEVLEFLDFSEWGDSILEIMIRHLQSESRDRCLLALRGLEVLSRDPSMARKMCNLSGRLLELLKNEDADVVRVTLSVLMNLLLNKDILVSSPTAPKLAEVLQFLFDHDNSHVQLLSIRLYKQVMESVVGKGKKRLKMLVSESLLPLFFHCHNENTRVAQASRETLLALVKFLKRRDLKQLLKMDDPWSFGERVLAEDRARAAEHLHRALPYLESPQEPLREAAIRTIGIAGMLMRGQPQELQLICEALQALNTDESPSNTNLIVQVMFDERAASLNSSSGQCQIPCRRRPPGDQKPAEAPETADAAQT
ncbi:maestro heat-like repeat-containing protein family member 6 isoform X1 [Oenanthe melanoleuca]|uniref:maestro heat-like repeat-containing protein family member 6 isoform X1 n=1 Tax=Oenanthe melanoleuca TaxID=2939378 RepID=UPI0024C194A6|nr:maestro heat-like repeat-containing protein family member 6 isoform X1 [Oenanthe melanoleuca]